MIQKFTIKNIATYNKTGVVFTTDYYSIFYR